jgi:hypothetical protein
MQKIKTSTGLIIIFVTAVVLFGGIFVYQYLAIQNINNSYQALVKQNQKQEILNKPFPLAGEIADQTAGWKTYTNDIQGYQIKYPEGATVVGDSNYKKYCITFNNNGGYIIIDSLKDEQDALNKGIIDMAGCSGIDGLGSGYKQITQSLNINGKTYVAQGYQYQDKTNDPYNEYLDTALIFQFTDNITIQFGYENKGDKQVSEKEYDDIINSLKESLSTFKFTN